MKLKNKIFIILPLLLASCNPINNSNDIVEIHGNLQMEINTTQQLTLSKEIDNVIWSSSNDFIARVKNGLVTAYNVGNVTINAKYDDKVASFDIEVIKSLNINSLNGLISILNENKNNEVNYQEIHYTEQANKSNTEEKLYRFNNNYYVDKKENYVTALGQQVIDNSQEFYGEYNKYCYDLNIGNNSYVSKKKIVEENAKDNEISKENLNNKLNQSIYLNRFITKFSDSYTGYVDTKDIIVESVIDKEIKTNYFSFSKHVWDNKINCDYKTYTSNFIFDLDGKLKSIDYQFKNYGDDQYNIELNKLNDDAEVKEYSSIKIEFLNENSLSTSPLIPTNYFINEIKEVIYQTNIKVGDILVNKNVKATSFIPNTALDYDNIEIYDVINPNDKVVISYDNGIYTASSQGEATLKIRMKNSLDVTYLLKVEVKSVEINKNKCS